MKHLRAHLWAGLGTLYRFILRHKYHVGALILILLWCLPYFTSGERTEWGDFDFFTQAYEAIRLSILEYHQFPWLNPWISGGVPLYANPQIGVFSVQTPLVLLFGAPLGLKLTVVLFTLAGYASMYILLRRYFKIGNGLSVLLSLVWIFSTFFVAHVPSHFTFIWYLIAPLYFYLALTIKTWRGGLLLGTAFAIMALAAVHNPLIHIGSIVGAVLAVRLIITHRSRLQLFISIMVAGGVFLLLAGHRIFFALQNIRAFPRELADPAASLGASVLGVVFPFSRVNEFLFKPPFSITAPYGFGEITSYIGIFATLAAVACAIFIIYQLVRSKDKLKTLRQKWLMALIILAIALLFFAIGLGQVHPLAPYSIMQFLPVIGEMRVSSRWFLWLSLCLLILIGITARQLPKKSIFKTALYTLVILSVLELFILNFGYQHQFFQRTINKPNKPTSSLVFAQTETFGSARALPDGTTIQDDGNLPEYFREYEATLFNTGVLQANDALIYKMSPEHSPRCGWEDRCGLVLSQNAHVTYWSPNRIVLERTADGPIELNMNNSSYFVINGIRNSDISVAEPFKPFIIEDSASTITIDVEPVIFK